MWLYALPQATMNCCGRMVAIVYMLCSFKACPSIAASSPFLPSVYDNPQYPINFLRVPYGGSSNRTMCVRDASAVPIRSFGLPIG